MKLSCVKRHLILEDKHYIKNILEGKNMNFIIPMSKVSRGFGYLQQGFALSKEGGHALAHKLSALCMTTNFRIFSILNNF